MCTYSTCTCAHVKRKFHLNNTYMYVLFYLENNFFCFTVYSYSMHSTVYTVVLLFADSATAVGLDDHKN